jgi:hypothetical protein
VVVLEGNKIQYHLRRKYVKIVADELQLPRLRCELNLSISRTVSSILMPCAPVHLDEAHSQPTRG